MAIEKSVYQAPPGLEDLQGLVDEPALEIEIEDPEAVKIGVDGVEINLEPEKEEKTGADVFDANLAEFMDDNAIESLGKELVEYYDADVESRKDWTRMYVEGLSLLGLEYEEKTEPWEGACGVYHPILAEAVVRFQSETIMETFPAAGPVKTTIIGKETPEKNDAADRVKADMNYQLTEVMSEYRPEHERLLWALPIAGSAFKKVYYDPTLGRQVASFIPPEMLVVPYGSSSLETAERVTHVMRKTENELKKLQAAGFYRDVELGEPLKDRDDIEEAKAHLVGEEAVSDADGRYRILEMHVELDLPGFEDKDKDGKPTGIALPYVVTVDRGSQKILAIRRNWYEDDPLKLKRQHFVHYTYVPGFGFYGFGMMHLIGGYAKSATSIIRQLVDAGSLANLPGGLKSKGLRVKGDDTPIAPGEWRDVDVPSGTVRDNILPLPYKEPSATLYQLLQTIVDEGRRFAAAADLKVSDMSANAPVGTTLAILERALKVMSAVQARVHFSMKQEFKLLKEIIKDYAPRDYAYDVDRAPRSARASDYDVVDVIPVSDPNAATMSQKVVQYQTVMQMAEKDPTIYNKQLLHRQMLDVIGIKNAAKLVPMPEDMKPKDPVTENMDILMGKPAKAFQYQDHEAHIAVHMSAMQDPKIMQMLQMNPQAPAIQAAALAHLNEHIAYAYRSQMEQMLGTALPPIKDDEGEDTTLPAQVEVELSRLTAVAAQKLLQKHVAEAQQQQAQQQAQDPLIQIEMAKLKLQEAEQKRKDDDSVRDHELALEKLKLEREKMEADKLKTGATIGAQVAQTKAKIESQEAIEGARMGIDVAKSKESLDMQREMEGARMGVDVVKHHADRADRKESEQIQREEKAIDREQSERMADKAAQEKKAEAKTKPTKKEDK